jgi:hypothetical protein
MGKKGWNGTRRNNQSPGAFLANQYIVQIKKLVIIYYDVPGSFSRVGNREEK